MSYRPVTLTAALFMAVATLVALLAANAPRQNAVGAPERPMPPR